MNEAAFRWPHDLRLGDLLALVVVGPLLGWWLMVGVLWFPGSEGLASSDIRSRLMDHTLAGFVGGLVAIGASLGVLSPRLRGLGAVTIMVPVIIFVINDYLVGHQEQNLIGVVILMYGAFTGLAVAAGFGATTLLGHLRARRRE